MNFYSDDIINKIIDNDPVEDLISNIDDFYKNVFIKISSFSLRSISPIYNLALLKDKKNKVVFRCIDTEFNVDNCPSILIYRKYYNKDM